MVDNGAGRPEYKLTDDMKKAAITYVRASGFFVTRLAKFLRTTHPTLKKLLDNDPDFYYELQAAEGEFIKEIVQNVKEKRPDFLLKSKYAEEFPDRVQVEHSGKLSFTEFIAGELAEEVKEEEIEDDNPET